MIIHQQQPDDVSCTHACLAMLLNTPVQLVVDRLKTFDGGMNTKELYRALDACKFDWNAFVFNNLVVKGKYLVSVPSLNVQSGAHTILLELTDEKIVVHDPQKGREGKRFYGYEGSPLKYFSEIVLVTLNKQTELPKEIINL